jgi:hypothetical protein
VDGKRRSGKGQQANDDCNDCEGGQRAPTAPLWGNRSTQHDGVLPLHVQIIANVSWPLGRCDPEPKSPDGRINSRSGHCLFPGLTRSIPVCAVASSSSVPFQGLLVVVVVAAGLDDEPSPSCSGHEGSGPIAWTG